MDSELGYGSLGLLNRQKRSLHRYMGQADEAARELPEHAPCREWLEATIAGEAGFGLAELVLSGFLRIVYGGADVGEYLCQHPAVDDIHISGSDKTHDRIVWGAPGPEDKNNGYECDGNNGIALGNPAHTACTPGGAL